MGINAISANKGQGSIIAGIDLLKRSKIIITKRSSNIRKENQYYSWQQTKDGRFLNVPKDFQNHCMDALRYSQSLNLPEIGKKSGYVLSC
jgi:phage terminase large subunit